jgi:probable HAF family extracellular repeat protein
MNNVRRWTRLLNYRLAFVLISSAIQVTFISNVKAATPVKFVITDLHSDDSVPSIALGINNSGQVVGNYGPNAFLGALPAPPIGGHAFLYDDGSVTQLNSLGGGSNWVWGISRNGLMAGAVKSLTGKKYPHAALFDGDSTVNLGTLGGDMSLAFDVNSRGQVVGWAENPQIDNRAFLYDDGVMIDLGTLGGESSEAHAINERGQIVGRSRRNSYFGNSQHAFLYQNGVMEELHSNLFFFSGSRSSEARDINDNGSELRRSWRIYYISIFH